MDSTAIEGYLRQQGLTPEQIGRAKRLLDQTSLDPTEAAFAVCLADGETEGDVQRDGAGIAGPADVTVQH